MARKPWFEYLSDEDRAFVRRFLLASGSLKQVAKEYAVSYPTIRLRLDRLIAKLEVVEAQDEVSEFERVLRARFAEGKIDHDTFKVLLSEYLREREEHREN